MRNIMLKELKLSASPLTYFFVLFELMFFLPGYPILCGAFFVTLGLFKGFQLTREANDIEFSMLLPISKKDIVRGKYYFVCFIEMCGLLLMMGVTLIRMTVLSGSAVYHANALMNANFYAIGCAFVIFGLFNVIFVEGFFKTAYNLGRPFITYLIVVFLMIGLFEASHYFPGLGVLNAFGFDHFGCQFVLMLGGLAAFLIMTWFSCRLACSHFEKIDL